MPHSQWSRRRLSHLMAYSRAKAKGIKVTRRDLKIFVPAFLALFSSSYSLTMLFPFLPFMIQFLLPQVEEENIGKYAGFIAASLFLGRFFGSYVWGALADKKGRKPVVVTSCILIGLSTVAFGFSVQIYMAVAFRFLTGLFNGVVGTVKAIISESSTNRSQALGMSLIICAFSLGLILGPAVSGALADPIDAVVRGFLTRFPYSLPCLVNFLVCLLAALAVAVWMPETLHSKMSKDSRSGSGDVSSSVSEDQQQLLVEPSEGDSSSTQLTETSQCTENTEKTETTIADEEGVELVSEGTSDWTSSGSEGRSNDFEEESGGDRRGSESPGTTRETKRRSSLVPFFNRRSSFTPSFFKPLRLPRAARNSNSGTSGKKYTSLHSGRQRLVFEEQEEEEEEEGAKGGQSVEGEEGERERRRGESEQEKEERTTLIGRVGQSFKKTLQNLKLFLTTRGTVLSLMIYCTFSFAMIGFDEVYSLWAAAASRLGGLGWTLHEIGISQAVSGALFLPFSFTLFPVLERRFGLTVVYQMCAITGLVCMVLLPIARSIPPDTLNPLRWFYIIMVLFVIRVAAGNVFAATALFINNSVVFDKLGEVNGLAHSLTALLRTIAPVFSGTIFSLSVSGGARGVGFPVNHYLIFLIFGLTILLCTLLGAGLPSSINRQMAVPTSGDHSTSVSIRTDEDSSSSGSGNGGPETSV